MTIRSKVQVVRLAGDVVVLAERKDRVGLWVADVASLRRFDSADIDWRDVADCALAILDEKGSAPVPARGKDYLASLGVKSDRSIAASALLTRSEAGELQFVETEKDPRGGFEHTGSTRVSDDDQLAGLLAQHIGPAPS